MTKHLHRIALLPLLLGLTAVAQAHEGHGLPGASHWHSTDVMGYVLAAGIGAALWFTRKK
ncbi:hypothetical protein [Sphaerotilus sp.]|uniref:hypothetical protein n=1 Tax=Sphaerotilus sp. TaxID=2093942 RepID=UPI00286E2D2D|nr:hypothetical protein [Sphaerotilus sp.]